VQYQNYKNTLQTLAQKIGDVEQEAEEHKYDITVHVLFHLFLSASDETTSPPKLGSPMRTLTAI
jgi:hypothetical protein